jgi:ketosteroid isomerase-like protein
LTTQADDAVREANERLVHELFRLESTGDYDGMCELMADDIEFDLPYGPASIPMPVRGRDAMHELITNLIGGMFTEFEAEITATYAGADPEVIVVEYRSDAVVRHNGGAYNNRYIAVLRIRDGKITFWREYHNPEESNRALAP